MMPLGATRRDDVDRGAGDVQAAIGPEGQPLGQTGVLVAGTTIDPNTTTAVPAYV